MADPYWRYGVVAPDRASTQRTSFPGHLSSEASALTGQPWSSNGLVGSSSDFLPRDILPLGSGSYGGDELLNIRSRPSVDGLVTSAGVQTYPSPIHDIRSGSGADGLVSSAGIQRYPSPIQDRSLLAQRHDAALGRSPRISDSIPQMHGSLTRTDAPLATAGESNVLFVDGLPTDCSRREVGHLFRPFIGFKEIKVVHKEARHRDDKAMVLCFVEFVDAKCALTAMEALQGYKFDDKKPESPVLQICFAHFPFRLPSHNEHQQLGPSQ